MIRRTLIAASFGMATLLATPAFALNILLTNDDGYNAPGIEAMDSALRSAGFNVIRFAPSSNRSGSSTSLTFTPVKVVKIARQVYSADASPAGTVILGTTVFAPHTDLIVSGINSGANIGPSTVVSGTVGATIAGITQLKKPIPGIAFSTDLLDSDPASAGNRRHFADVAAFGVRLIKRVTTRDAVTGIGNRQTLNVNYPALAPRQVKGVQVNVQGVSVLFPPAFVQDADGNYVSAARPVQPAHDVPGSDTLAFYDGYATVVPLNGDYTAYARRPALRRSLIGLQP